MNETELIKKYKILKERASVNGISLIIGDNEFCFDDVPKAKGRIILKTLNEVELFIYGYSLGYSSGI